MVKWGAIAGLVILLSSCGSKEKGGVEQEDLVAKGMMQGVWVNEETEMPLMHIKGDTIFYADSQNVPIYFKVIRDSLFCYGNNVISYKIDRQTDNSFWFHSLPDQVLKLRKSDDAEDTFYFTRQVAEVIPVSSEVLKRDSAVVYNGTRYRGYVYINPSKMRVIKTSYSEEGIGMEQVYYDNVIHICVYDGKKLLYGQDITKQMFETVVSTELLEQTILSDMNFMGVDPKGYHYQAVLSVPETPVSNLINLTIDFNKQLSIKKAE